MSSCLAPRVLWTQLILLNTYQMSTLVEELIMKGMKVKVTQSCLTLCDPMDYTVHEILQAKILEWVAFPFSRGSSQRRAWTQVSHIASRFFTSWATQGKPKSTGVDSLSLLQGIFLTQESNWGLLRCRWILYQLSLSYQGSPDRDRALCKFINYKFLYNL